MICLPLEPPVNFAHCVSGSRHDPPFSFLHIQQISKINQSMSAKSSIPYFRCSTEFSAFLIFRKDILFLLRLPKMGEKLMSYFTLCLRTPPWISCTVIVNEIILFKSTIPTVSISEKKLSVLYQEGIFRILL